MRQATFNSASLMSPFAAAALSLGGCAVSAETLSPPAAPPAMFLTAEPEPKPTDEPASLYRSTLCEAEEVTAFAGEVEDDFGLSVAICVLEGSADAPATITAVWAGEGGTSRTSCKAGDCSDVIRYSRYTRYRFTELKVSWEAFDHTHVITETHNAEDTSKEPASSASYTWASDEMNEQEVEPLTDPITVWTEPLTLMMLDSLVGE